MYFQCEGGDSLVNNSRMGASTPTSVGSIGDPQPGSKSLTPTRALTPRPFAEIDHLIQEVFDPNALIMGSVADIRDSWQKREGDDSGPSCDWGLVAHDLVQLVVTMMREKPKMTEAQFDESRLAGAWGGGRGVVARV